MKTNLHQFVLTVKTERSREEASTAVLAAFGTRQPDDCAFFLSNSKEPAVREMQRQLREALGRERFYQRKWEALLAYVAKQKS